MEGAQQQLQESQVRRALLRAGRRVDQWTATLPLPAGEHLNWLVDRPVDIERCPNCNEWYLARIYRSPSHERESCIEMGRNPDTARMRQRLAAATSRASRCDHCAAHQQQEQKQAALEKRKQQRREAAAHRLTTCEHCGASFTPQRSTARFCSTRCRTAAHRAGPGAQP
jgi:hypothetical protein